MAGMPFSAEGWARAKREGRRIMIEIARKETWITYSELADRVTEIVLPQHGHEMDTFLCEISEAEVKLGRDMLTAVVVLKNGGVPGGMFYDLAVRLKKMKPGENKDKFWSDELRRVHERSWPLED